MMQGRRYWIDKGHLRVINAAQGPSGHDEDQHLHREGIVRLTTGEIGTEIRWSVFSPCFASLFATIEWLPSGSAPFVLRYYLSGWFEEVHQTADETRTRMEEIMAKSDLHVSRRTFVQQMQPLPETLPPLLRESLEASRPLDEFAVECVHDEFTNQFRVERVGAKSMIARVYGTAPASFPCKNGNSYDRTVSEAYNEVLATGRPRYDHVLASMCTPDNTQHWVPYHRVIFPSARRSGAASVAVMSEIAKVGIRII